MNSSLNINTATTSTPETTAATPVVVLKQLLSNKPTLIRGSDKVHSHKYISKINRAFILMAICFGSIALWVEACLKFSHELKGFLVIGTLAFMMFLMAIFSRSILAWAHAKAEAENTLRAEARRPEFEKEMVAWRRQLNKFFIQNTSEIQGFNFALLHLINENWEAVLPHLIDQLKDENSDLFRRIVVYRNELYEVQQAAKEANDKLHMVKGK